jgi:hypothetical protein
MAEAFKIADAYVQVETRYDRDQIGNALEDILRQERARIRRMGRRDIGEPLGDGAADGMGDALRNGMRRRARRDSNHMVRNLVVPFLTGFVKAISLGFANVNIGRAFMNNPYAATAGLAFGALIATWIGAGIAATLSAALAGIFGLGLIGLGAFLLRNEAEIVAAATHLGETFKYVFERAAGPMLIPIVASLNLLNAAIKRGQGAIDKLFLTLSPAIIPLTHGLIGFMKGLGPGLLALAQVGQLVLLDLAAALPGWGKSLGDFFIKIRDNWPEIRKSLHEFFSDLGTVLGALANAFIWLATHYDLLKTIVSTIAKATGIGLLFSMVKGVIKGVMDIDDNVKKLIRIFGDLPGNILGKIRGLWAKIKSPFDMVSHGMRINALGMVSGFIGIIAGLPGRVIRAIGSLWAKIRGPFDRTYTSLRATASNMVGAFVNIIYTLPSKALRAISRLRALFVAYFAAVPGMMARAGAAAISGLIGGIGSMIGRLRDKLWEVANIVTDIIRQKLRLQSPSREMMDIGVMAIRGLEIGVDKRKPMLRRQMTGVAAGIPEAVKSQIPKQYMPTSTVSTNHISIPVSVTVPVGADGPKVGREVAREIRKALDDYDRSVKK